MEIEMPPEGYHALWRRVDTPGHEAVRIYQGEQGWNLDGSAIFLYDGKPCRLEYLIECDAEWRTLFATVDGFVGDDVVAVEIELDGDWWYLTLNEEVSEVSEVSGCIDVDLNFSPVTNLLPIKRLNLEVGESQVVRAAWLRFPSFSLEALEQTYTRLDEFLYGYRSSTDFEAKITVDRSGLVVEYGDLWMREA